MVSGNKSFGNCKFWTMDGLCMVPPSGCSLTCKHVAIIRSHSVYVTLCPYGDVQTGNTNILVSRDIANEVHVLILAGK
jgi:hypothetical protein